MLQTVSFTTFFTALPKTVSVFRRDFVGPVGATCLSVKEDALYYLTLSKHPDFQLLSKHSATENAMGENDHSSSFPLDTLKD